MQTASAALLVVLVSCAGCAKRDSDNRATDSHSAADSLANMVGVSATAENVVEQMELHLKATQELTTDSMKALLPRHRQLAENLIVAFNKEMREMNVTADSAWTATVDSVRADLRVMPRLEAADLQIRMPAHDARLVRLIQMHESIIKNRTR